MKNKLLFAVVATIVALCTVSCSESTGENSGENFKKGIVFRAVVYGRTDAMTDVLLEDGTYFSARGKMARFLAPGDTVLYRPVNGSGFIEAIHWKK